MLPCPVEDLPPRPKTPRALAKWEGLRETHNREVRLWLDLEEARIQRQRAPLSRFLHGNAAKLLVNLMLDRCRQLLDAGEAEMADEIGEFIPEARYQALLDEVFGD